MNKVICRSFASVIIAASACALGLGWSTPAVAGGITTSGVTTGGVTTTDAFGFGVCAAPCSMACKSGFSSCMLFVNTLQDEQQWEDGFTSCSLSWESCDEFCSGLIFGGGFGGCGP